MLTLTCADAALPDDALLAANENVSIPTKPLFGV